MEEGDNRDEGFRIIGEEREERENKRELFTVVEGRNME